MVTLMRWRCTVLAGLIAAAFTGSSTNACGPASFATSAPSFFHLCARMSFRSAVVFRACPAGYITNPESCTFPPLSVMRTDVGMPSG